MSILDTACARLSLGQNATPPAIEDLTREIGGRAMNAVRAQHGLGALHANRTLARAADAHSAAMLRSGTWWAWTFDVALLVLAALLITWAASAGQGAAPVGSG